MKDWESGVEDSSEYLRHLIANADAENLIDRAILREIKLLVKILATSACRRALAKLEIAPGSLIPWNRLTAACLVITLGTMLPLAFSAIVPIVVEALIHQDIRPAMLKRLKETTNPGPQAKNRP